MSPSPTTKASVKEHKSNKKDKFSPFWGSIGWKKEWDSDRSKIVRVDELFKLTNHGVVLFWKKELRNLALPVIFIYQYYKDKYNF